MYFNYNINISKCIKRMKNDFNNKLQVIKLEKDMILKTKLFIILTIMFFVLLMIPLVLINLAKPHEFMGVMIFLFFIINPIATAIINFMIGKDIKKLWWIPILFCVVFLLSYWLMLKEIVLDLLLYAGFYLIIGLLFMSISQFIKKKI